MVLVSVGLFQAFSLDSVDNRYGPEQQGTEGFQFGLYFCGSVGFIEQNKSGLV